MEQCIFCRILKKEIPAAVVYEDNNVLAFRDINPQAPVHIVVIPKAHIETLNDIQDASIVGPVFQAVQKIVKTENVNESGYRVVANCNKDAGQTVFHIHFHILGGRVFHWPPG